jgi:hypothetical protein
MTVCADSDEPAPVGRYALSRGKSLACNTLADALVGKSTGYDCRRSAHSGLV